SRTRLATTPGASSRRPVSREPGWAAPSARRSTPTGSSTRGRRRPPTCWSSSASRARGSRRSTGCGSSWNGRSSVTTDYRSAKVGVLMGGLSSEREVSLESGAGVLEALMERGFDAVAIDWQEGMWLPNELEEHDVEVVWIALHGTYGEDGAVQGLLGCLGLPYTGSGILASALAMDKVASKRIFESNGVPTPRWRIMPPDAAASALDGFGLPLVIKPALEGSSVGVSVVHRRAQIADALARARRHRGPTLAEAYIPGAE